MWCLFRRVGLGHRRAPGSWSGRRKSKMHMVKGKMGRARSRARSANRVRRAMPQAHGRFCLTFTIPPKGDPKRGIRPKKHKHQFSVTCKSLSSRIDRRLIRARPTGHHGLLVAARREALPGGHEVAVVGDLPEADAYTGGNWGVGASESLFKKLA